MCAYPEFLNVTEPRAKTPKFCHECGGRVGIGEKYTRVAGKWEGDFSVTVQCDACATLWNYVNGEVECLSFGGLWSAVRELDYNVPREMMSHTMLMGMHEHEIERAENEDDGVEILPEVADKTFGRLFTLWQDMRDPKKWQKRKQAWLERLAEKQRSLNYYLEHQFDENSHGRWCREQLLAGKF